MINIFITRKADIRGIKIIDWIDERKIEYQIINKEDLTFDLLKHLLSLSDNGFESLLLSKMKAFKRYEKLEKYYNLEVLSTSQMIDLVLKNPYLIKSPIIFDEKRMLVGYNEDELRMFLDRNVREIDRIMRKQK